MHRAEAGDAAHIVAGQVHEHHMLRPLLWVGQELATQCLVLSWRGAAWPCAGQGARHDGATIQAHQDLGR